MVCKYFLHSTDHFLISLKHKIFNFNNVKFSLLPSLVPYLRNHCLMQSHEDVFGFMFRSLIYFELYEMRWRPTLFHVDSCNSSFFKRTFQTPSLGRHSVFLLCFVFVLFCFSHHLPAQLHSKAER